MIKIQGPNNIKMGKKKENSFIIFIDFDGVLDNWLKGTCEVCGIDMKEKELYSKLKNNEMLDKTGVVSANEMWKKIAKEGTSFWANLELLPWAKKLIEEMEKLGEVYFLTSPGTCIPAPSGKMEWTQKYFPKKLKSLIICKDKEMCAKPNSILIDDTKEKIDAFREAGGHAFFWPNQFKLMDGDISVDETIEKLKEEIRGYIG